MVPHEALQHVAAGRTVRLRRIHRNKRRTTPLGYRRGWCIRLFEVRRFLPTKQRATIELKRRNRPASDNRRRESNLKEEEKRRVALVVTPTLIAPLGRLQVMSGAPRTNEAYRAPPGYRATLGSCRLSGVVVHIAQLCSSS